MWEVSNMSKVALPPCGAFFLARNFRFRQPPTRGGDYVGFASLLLVIFLGCGSSDIKPVDIYAEDMCSHCRMAISDQRFASEIITVAGEVFKFDDIGCMERFKEKSSDLKIVATFVKDYETKNWITHERSTIVQTSIKTPMSSGKVALADSARAKKFLDKFPANEK
jgi:copper chaperone NosL